jgi:hypothetical protein
LGHVVEERVCEVVSFSFLENSIYWNNQQLMIKTSVSCHSLLNPLRLLLKILLLHLSLCNAPIHCYTPLLCNAAPLKIIYTNVHLYNITLPIPHHQLLFLSAFTQAYDQAAASVYRTVLILMLVQLVLKLPLTLGIHA